MDYKTFNLLYRRGIFEAFNIKTMGDLKQFLERYEIIHKENDDILFIRKVKKMNNTHRLIGLMIKEIIENQKEIDKLILKEPNNIFLYKMWWTLEETKDNLKELYNKV